MFLTWLRPSRLLNAIRFVVVTYFVVACLQISLFRDDNQRFSTKTNNKRKTLIEDEVTTPVSGKKRFPMPTNRVKSVITLQTYWRSGSTFTGELISNYPGVFYRYEPFMYLDLFRELDPEQTKLALKTLRHLARCEYENVDEFFQQVRFGEWNSDTLFHYRNCSWPCFRRPVEACLYQSNPSLCFSEPTERCLGKLFLSEACRRSSSLLFKIVRLRLAKLAMLLDEPAFHHLKIINLVRDPRAIISSRNKRRWCITDACRNPVFLCEAMRKDIEVGETLKRLYPQQFFHFRFEDLSLWPYETTKKLFNFLQLPSHPRIDFFLRKRLNTFLTHTFYDHDGKLQSPSTHKKPVKAIFRWVDELPLEEILTIQRVCGDVLQKLGYKLVNSTEQMYSFYPIGSYGMTDV
ncbi:carbohydrate sulfotransferase 4-like [Tachypleus tridentatus]|uniref:carbohydrate sulfotransferase 4-like n=1 Tax=Tachypleus tridentatus TaxID=6853 RepID=UPI003FD4BA7B